VKPRTTALAVIALLAASAPVLADDDDGAAHPRPGAHRGTALVHASAHVLLLGRSVRGRPIRALVEGDPRATAAVLVVGCIHGDEPAGIAVTERLRHWAPPAGIVLWLVPDLNPDGRAAHTRQNAHGVDLNRNFPYRWRPLGPLGTQQYSGSGPLSEPESRIAHSLILRLKPRLTIWFHQPLGVTDRSGGDVRLEHRFARLSGLPLSQLPRYPGSATTWQDFRLHAGTAFVVELPPGRPRDSAVARYAHAVERLVTQAARRA
jgi:protein MpaA